jgi:hypothetical protein
MDEKYVTTFRPVSSCFSWLTYCCHRLATPCSFFPCSGVKSRVFDSFSTRHVLTRRSSRSTEKGCWHTTGESVADKAMRRPTVLLPARAEHPHTRILLRRITDFRIGPRAPRQAGMWSWRARTTHLDRCRASGRTVVAAV